MAVSGPAGPQARSSRHSMSGMRLGQGLRLFESWGRTVGHMERRQSSKGMVRFRHCLSGAPGLALNDVLASSSALKHAHVRLPAAAGEFCRRDALAAFRMCRQSSIGAGCPRISAGASFPPLCTRPRTPSPEPMAAAKLVPDETTLAGLAKALDNVIHIDLATRRACELD